MKRFNYLLLSCLLLSSGTLYAQNDNKENEFTISTQIRPRAEYRNGALTPRHEGQQSAGFINNRARISMEYKRSDLTMKFSAQHVGVWGQDAQVDKNGRFILNEAWARMNLGKGFFGQAGRQTLSYDDERILGALDWNVAGRYHDALKLGYENANNKLHLILSFNQNDEYTYGTYYKAPTPNNYKSMQTLWYNVSSSDHPFNASFLFMNLGQESGDDPNTKEGKTKYMQTFGTYLTYAPNNLTINGTFYYQTGKTKDNTSIAAYMASLRAQYKFTNEWSATIASDYLSGSKAGDDKLKAFNPLYGTHHKFYGTMDYFYASSLKDNIVNPGLWDNQLGIAYKPSTKVGLSLNYHYFVTAQKYKDESDSYSKGLGSEFDFQVDWPIMKDVKLSAGYSFMLGTKTMDAIKGGDHKRWQDWGWVSLNINPKVLFVKW